jgi:hypothetical protein
MTLMKKSIVKVLSILFLMVSLFSVSASANTSGWYPHCYVTKDVIAWEYTLPNGELASGWQYIDGYWYYFSDDGLGIAEVGMFTYNSELNAWVGGIPTMIHGKTYCFNTDSQLLVNTDIIQGSGHFRYHIDNNGNIDDTYNY